jgi:hypothetical protein
VSVLRGLAGGVAGTIALLARSLRAGGMLLIGEPFWRQVPPTDAIAQGCQAHAISDFLTLPDLLGSFGQLGYDIVEMVLADQDSWDRYEAAKWLTLRRWLEANPDDDFTEEVRASLTSEPVRYAAYTREYVGWGGVRADAAVTRGVFLGRCPRLVWGRPVGAPEDVALRSGGAVADRPQLWEDLTVLRGGAVADRPQRREGGEWPQSRGGDLRLCGGYVRHQPSLGRAGCAAERRLVEAAGIEPASESIFT